MIVNFGSSENISKALSLCFKFIVPSNLTNLKPRFWRWIWMISRNFVNWENTTVFIVGSFSRVAIEVNIPDNTQRESNTYTTRKVYERFCGRDKIGREMENGLRSESEGKWMGKDDSKK